jgi:L-fuconolactonase
MKIDAHQHFWKYDPARDGWIDENMKVIRRDFLPKDLVPVLEKNDVDGCIAVQADQSEYETEFLLGLAKNNSFIKGVVGWVDLRADNIEERLTHYSSNNLLKGVRHIVQAEYDDFILEEKFQHGISLLKQFGLTYDILVLPQQLPATIQLVNKFPSQKFIVDHMAKPTIKNGKMVAWKKNMEELAKAQNVFCKASGLVTEADWKNWKNEDFTIYLDVIFNAFGVKRILYGSDWPVCLLAAEYEKQLEILSEYIAKYSLDDKAKIMGGNANNFYNLNLKK